MFSSLPARGIVQQSHVPATLSVSHFKRRGTTWHEEQKLEEAIISGILRHLIMNKKTMLSYLFSAMTHLA
jgi:hypothetical protein